MTSGGNNAGFGNIVDLCIYHSNPHHDYGNLYADDPDRSGECAKTLDAALDYIEDPNKMEFDLTLTLDDLLNDPAVSGNPNFLLYLTGYAQFFGTDYDPCCDTETWSIQTANPFTPYLSVNLRQDFNDQFSRVNDLYKPTAQSDKYKSKVRYVDVDTGFAGHRFCEPGATRDDQFNTTTTFDKVYLWNLNWLWQVTGQGAPSPQAAQGNPSAQEAQAALNGQPVTAWNIPSGGGGNFPDSGWRLRPFHPRYTGYTTIKEAIFAQLKIDGRPEQNPTPPNNPTPTGTTAPAPSCSHVNNGSQCHCTDGSTPAPDEDNRCCLYNQPNGNDQCFD